MKYLNFIFLILVYSCFPIKQVGLQYKCKILSEILNEHHIAQYISNHRDNSSIRITDFSDYFGEMRCGFKRYSVRVNTKLKVDLNSGRFIDIIILSFNKKDNNLIEFEIFYSKRTSECERDFLMKGKVIIEKTSKGVILQSSKFGIID